MSVILGAVASIYRKWKKFDNEDWVPLIIAGTLSFGAYTLLLTIGFQQTSVINGAIIFDTSPIFSMFFAVLFKQEKWSWDAFWGALVALCGVVISSFAGQSDASNSLTGDLFVLLASISIALGTVFAHKLGKKQDPFAQTAIMGFIGLLILIPLSIKDFKDVSFGSFNWIEWAMLLFIGIFGGAIAFGSYFKSVENFGASSTMTYIYFSVPIGVIMNYFFLGEIVTPVQAIGAVIVTSGALWSIHARTKQADVKAAHTHL